MSILTRMMQIHHHDGLGSHHPRPVVVHPALFSGLDLWIFLDFLCGYFADLIYFIFSFGPLAVLCT